MNSDVQPVADASPTGGVLAALLAGGVGCAAMGLLTLLAAVSKPFNGAMAIYKPSGALSGEAVFAVVVWAACWFVLARLWRGKSPRQTPVLITAYTLLLAGLLMTFPPFLHLFLPRLK